MKYVSREVTGAFDLTRYEEYLEREREGLATHIHGADLLTIGRFVPTGPGSFHDARFESLITTGGVAPTGRQAQIVRVELRLKGPYFDRHFELQYEDVYSCSFQLPAPADDLLMHEVRIENGVLTHELQFDNGKTIVLTCREMSFLERLESSGGVSG